LGAKNILQSMVYWEETKTYLQMSVKKFQNMYKVSA